MKNFQEYLEKAIQGDQEAIASIFIATGAYLPLGSIGAFPLGCEITDEERKIIEQGVKDNQHSIFHFFQGALHYQSGHRQSAIRRLELAAVDQPWAMVVLGQILDYDGAEKNKWLPLYERAAELNNSVALYRLGILFGFEDREKALQYHERAARLNNPYSLITVGKDWEEESISEAAKYYRKAAQIFENLNNMMDKNSQALYNISCVRSSYFFARNSDLEKFKFSYHENLAFTKTLPPSFFSENADKVNIILEMLVEDDLLSLEDKIIFVREAIKAQPQFSSDFYPSLNQSVKDFLNVYLDEITMLDDKFADHPLQDLNAAVAGFTLAEEAANELANEFEADKAAAEEAARIAAEKMAEQFSAEQDAKVRAKEETARAAADAMQAEFEMDEEKRVKEEEAEIARVEAVRADEAEKADAAFQRAVADRFQKAQFPEQFSAMPQPLAPLPKPNTSSSLLGSLFSAEAMVDAARGFTTSVSRSGTIETGRVNVRFAGNAEAPAAASSTSVQPTAARHRLFIEDRNPPRNPRVPNPRVANPREANSAEEVPGRASRRQLEPPLGRFRSKL